MPKPVHDMVNKMLANPDFYPEKSEKQQKAIAWATAWSQYKKKKKRKKKSDYGFGNERLAELQQLDYEIDLLESHGLTKEASVLNDKFIRLSQNNISVEQMGDKYQIMLNGEIPYKNQISDSPVEFTTLDKAQMFADKLKKSM
jgi:hypothetical protein